IRTEAALVCSRKPSRETAGSSNTESSRKRSASVSRAPSGVGLPLSAIDSLLARAHADPPVSVEEPLAGLAYVAIALDRAFHRIDHAVLVEAGAGDFGLRGVLVARSAEQELVVLLALPVDAEDADMAGVMVAAGVDAAADLDLQL